MLAGVSRASPHGVWCGLAVLPRLERDSWGAGARPGKGGTRPWLLRSPRRGKLSLTWWGGALCLVPTPGTCGLKHFGKEAFWRHRPVTVGSKHAGAG